MLDLPKIALTRSNSCHKTDTSYSYSSKKLDSQNHIKLHDSVIIGKDMEIKKPKFYPNEQKK